MPTGDNGVYLSDTSASCAVIFVTGISTSAVYPTLQAGSFLFKRRAKDGRFFSKTTAVGQAKRRAKCLSSPTIDGRLGYTASVRLC